MRGFCLLWGVSYYADSFQQQSGICTRSVPWRLGAVTADFARRLAAAKTMCSGTRDGCFAVSARDLRRAVGVRAPPMRGVPVCADRITRPRPSAAPQRSAPSRLRASAPSPEANLNVDAASFLPHTIVHEIWPHQRGIASEQVKLHRHCRVSGQRRPMYRYSGLLMGVCPSGQRLCGRTRTGSFRSSGIHCRIRW